MSTKSITEALTEAPADLVDEVKYEVARNGYQTVTNFAFYEDGDEEARKKYIESFKVSSKKRHDANVKIDGKKFFYGFDFDGE